MKEYAPVVKTVDYNFENKELDYFRIVTKRGDRDTALFLCPHCVRSTNIQTEALNSARAMLNDPKWNTRME